MCMRATRLLPSVCETAPQYSCYRTSLRRGVGEVEYVNGSPYLLQSASSKHIDARFVYAHRVALYFTTVHRDELTVFDTSNNIVNQTL